METLTMVWSIFGFFAFIFLWSLQGRVAKLERRLREMDEGATDERRMTMQDALRNRIGKHVKFDFYDEEEDMDLLIFDTRNGFIEIVDVDDKWVHIHAESKQKQIDKLIRISSIKGIEEQL